MYKRGGGGGGGGQKNCVGPIKALVKGLVCGMECLICQPCSKASYAIAECDQHFIELPSWSCCCYSQHISL